MSAPSDAELVVVMRQLLGGVLSREAASRWAAPYLLDEVGDPLVDDALYALVLIDARQIDEEGRPGDFMYGFEVVEEPLRRLRLRSAE